MKNRTLKLLLTSTMLVGVGTLASCGEKPTSEASQPVSQETSSQEGSQEQSQEQSQEESQEASSQGTSEDEGDKVPAKDAEGYEGLLSDAEAYSAALGKYETVYARASAEKDLNKRFVLMAEAEAELLASGIFVPTTTQGGNYGITRAGFRTVPYVQFGPDSDRLHSVVVGDKFVTKEDREAMKAVWEKAVKGEGDYDVAAIKAIMTEKGYQVQNEYKAAYTSDPETWDAFATSAASDTDMIICGLDGLVQYDNLGRVNPVCGTLPQVSEDGLEYSFTINADESIKWVEQDGKVYAPVTADDFVAGFQHMLDAQGGLEWLVEGVIEGVDEYLAGEAPWSAVGVKAEGNKLTYRLTKEIPYFETMLTYSIFFPMCRDYYVAQGGKFGTAFDSAAEDYNYGKDPAHILYNGAFRCTEHTATSKITFEANSLYTGTRGVDKLSFTYYGGGDDSGYLASAIDGTYAGAGLNNARLELLKKDHAEIFTNCAYISDTNSTTYFGGWNLNRQRFALDDGACASPKTLGEAKQFNTAILNQSFRTALSHSIDRVTMNAVSTGAELAAQNLRNMYTAPAFVQLSAATTDDYGHEFSLGSSFGEMVQYYIDTNYNGEYNVADGQDGWYNKDLAASYIVKAEQELGEGFFANPVEIDIVYEGSDQTSKGQAEAVKASIEEALKVGDKQYVVVNLIAAASRTEYLKAGYRAPTGHDADYDLFYGSGWGPDYGDPSTYLDTFNRTGYMIKVVGLNNASIEEE
jgi:peptide/nickel transport system substrate-binding protein/oligopeptide transport system substrate-binding protein